MTDATMTDATITDTLVTPAIRINGTRAPLTAALLTELLAQHDVAADGKGVAVALNGRIVRRAVWGETQLSDGDDIEIVVVRQGG